MDKTLIGVMIVSSLVATLIYQKRSSRTHLSHDHESALSATKAPDREAKCVASKNRFRWPVDGENGRDWVIVNYVDHDERRGSLKDFTGSVGDAALTYDSHTGLDIELASFRAMDQGVPVRAVAPGKVEEIYDQSPDRNQICAKDKWNYVKIRHENGYATVYGHLRRGSVSVNPGDRVSEGAVLALIGSSGCSAFPHLHFEVLDCREQVLDPIALGLFRSAPKYPQQTPPQLMEVLLFQPAISSTVAIQDPQTSSLERISLGMSFSIALTISNVRAFDVLSIELIDPNGTRAHDLDFVQTMDRFRSRSHWWGNFRVNIPGRWTYQIKINGRFLTEKAFIALESI